MLCDCSCAHPCPLRKCGSETRCNLAKVAAHFGCQESEALDRLHEWWPTGRAEAEARWEDFRRVHGPFTINIVGAERGD